MNKRNFLKTCCLVPFIIPQIKEKKFNVVIEGLRPRCGARGWTNGYLEYSATELYLVNNHVLSICKTLIPNNKYCWLADKVGLFIIKYSHDYNTKFEQIEISNYKLVEEGGLYTLHFKTI